MRNLRRLAIFLLVMFGAFAQLDRGVITGVVSDPSGAAVPRVKVTVRSVATGAVYEAVASDTGQYTQPNLPVGEYQVTFDAPGFKRLVRSGIHLSAAQVVRVDVKLEIGAVTEAVEVTAEVPRLQTDSPEVGTVLDNRSLIDLPLDFSSGRRPESFAFAVSPGVGGTSYTSHINGSTGFSKEMLVDGASITVNQSGDVNAGMISPEALEEVKVQTAGMSAEFGRTQGGIFNLVLKSGGNQIHGSGYLALRNEALNANSFADNYRGAKRPQDRKQNWAGSFGGPVYIPKLYDGRNRTFFYFAYERYKERSYGLGSPSRTVPIPDFYEGDFSRLLGPVTTFRDALNRQVVRGAIYDPATFRQVPGTTNWVGDMFPGNRIPVSRFSRVARNLNAIAKAHYLPTVRDATGEIPLVNNAAFPKSGAPEWDHHLYSVKVDQVISSYHKLSGSWYYHFSPRLILDSGGMWDPTDRYGGPLAKARTRNDTGGGARLAEDWTITPRLLNHFTLSYNRRGNPQKIIYADTDGAKELGIANLSTIGYPVVNWGAGPFVSLETPGFTTYSFRADVSWGVLDTISFTRGRHFLKVGGDMRRNHQNLSNKSNGAQFNFAARATAIPNAAFSGNQTGYAFASYLLGIVDSASLSDPVPMGGRRHYYALFVQDDFKVSGRLTLNLGLRWEFQPPVFEVADRYSSWNPAKIDPQSGLPGAYDFAGHCQLCTGKRYFGRKNWRDFGPRVGFAWRPFEKWTLRGAYGILYEADSFNGYNPTPLGKATSTAWGGTYSLGSRAADAWAGIFNWDDGFPTDRYTPAGYDLSWGNSNRPGMVDPNYGLTPYVQQWNLNLQRQLPAKVVLDIAYLGNKGTRLKAGELARINQLPPSVLETYGAKLNTTIRNAADAAAAGIRYPYPGFSGSVASALRPYPQVTGNQTVNVYGTPLGFSTYHSLQVTVNRQYGKGLSVYANYVWSKTMANVDSSLIGDNSGPLDYYNLKLEKAVASYDTPHFVKAFFNYELPVGRGKPLLGGAGRALNAVAGGWAVSGIMNYGSGQPLGFSASTPLSGGWNGALNRANIAPGEMKAAGFDKGKFELSTVSSPNNTYLNKALFSQPAPLTLGTSAPRYSQVRGFGTISEDLCIQKSGKLSEKVRLRLRAELLDAFNRHRLGGIVTNVNNPNFGQVTTVSGNRQIQASLRLDF